MLHAVHDDGVAVGKVIADGGDIESAIGQPVTVRAFFVFSTYQSQRRRLVAKQLEKPVDRGGSRQEGIEGAGAGEVVLVLTPDLVEKGLDREWLKQPGQRYLGVNARRALPHQSCSPPCPASPL